MSKTKKEIMDTNKFNQELIKMKQSIQQLQEVRSYVEWVDLTNAKIAEINKRIRSTNKRFNDKDVL